MFVLLQTGLRFVLCACVCCRHLLVQAGQQAVIAAAYARPSRGPRVYHFGNVRWALHGRAAKRECRSSSTIMIGATTRRRFVSDRNVILKYNRRGFFLCDKYVVCKVTATLPPSMSSTNSSPTSLFKKPRHGVAKAIVRIPARLPSPPSPP